MSTPRASAAQRTIAVVGDAWTLRILRSVFRGQRRHGDFLQGFGVSRAVLTDRLTKLVSHGVLLRDVSGGGHPEYRLTERGLDLWSLFVAMWLWQIDWAPRKTPTPGRPMCLACSSHTPAVARPCGLRCAASIVRAW